MSVPHRIQRILVCFALVWLTGLMELTVTGQHHESAGHATPAKASKAKAAPVRHEEASHARQGNVVPAYQLGLKSKTKAVAHEAEDAHAPASKHKPAEHSAPAHKAAEHQADEHKTAAHEPPGKTSHEASHEASHESGAPAGHESEHGAAEHADAEHAAGHETEAEGQHGEHAATAETEHGDTHGKDSKAKEENYENLPFMKAEQAEATAETPGITGLLMRVTGALLLILGLIAVTAWAVRKYGTKPPANTPDFAVLATLPLGDRHQVSAVRFGNSMLLLGSTAQAITLLAMRNRRPPQPVPQPHHVQEMPQARSVGSMLANQPAPAPASQTATQPLNFADELSSAQQTGSFFEVPPRTNTSGNLSPATIDNFDDLTEVKKSGDLSREAA